MNKGNQHISKRQFARCSRLLIGAAGLFTLVALGTHQHNPYVLAATPAPNTAQPPRIMTWRVLSPEWQSKLHVSAFRIGCSSPPLSCLKSIAALGPDVSVTFSVPFKPETASYAAQYSQLSLQSPTLKEISVDDFVSQYQKLSRAGVKDPASFLQQYIGNLKKYNPNLKFGGTIYEDDLSSGDLNDNRLPASLRAQFDSVHFFLHFRGDAPNYDSYMQQIKRLFPNAQIGAGIYAYDRIAYIACLPHGHPCSRQEEISDFSQSVDGAFSALGNGEASWIEIFPGIFGNEAGWSDWKDGQTCRGDTANCIANTQKMDQIIATKIQGLSQ